jgi:hypothetical protein
LEKRRKAKNDKMERSGEQKLPADLFTVPKWLDYLPAGRKIFWGWAYHISEHPAGSGLSQSGTVHRFPNNQCPERPTSGWRRQPPFSLTPFFQYCRWPNGGLECPFYMKKEIHVRPRLSNILVQKFFHNSLWP